MKLFLHFCWRVFWQIGNNSNLPAASPCCCHAAFKVVPGNRTVAGYLSSKHRVKWHQPACRLCSWLQFCQHVFLLWRTDACAKSAKGAAGTLIAFWPGGPHSTIPQIHEGRFCNPGSSTAISYQVFPLLFFNPLLNPKIKHRRWDGYMIQIRCCWSPEMCNSKLRFSQILPHSFAFVTDARHALFLFCFFFFFLTDGQPTCTQNTSTPCPHLFVYRCVWDVPLQIDRWLTDYVMLSYVRWTLGSEEELGREQPPKLVQSCILGADIIPRHFSWLSILKLNGFVSGWLRSFPCVPLEGREVQLLQICPCIMLRWSERFIRVLFFHRTGMFPNWIDTGSWLK